MILKGLQKTTLIDFPGKIACTLFTAGCNFKCGFCQNPSLISFDSENSIEEKEIFSFLESRKKWLNGVCITGGEPTLQKDLPEFCKKIKEKGFLVKLDSNGSNPEMLKKLIKEKLVDYIAMDIKTSQEKYSDLCGVKVDLEKIKQSIELIKNSGLDYEFRTTVLPDFFSKEDALKIGEWLKGSKLYVLQQFRNDLPMVDPEFKNKDPFPPEKLFELKEILESFFVKVEIRNL
ncbi:anaerobic ribonucleoside-triphosphate reductase activating protein [Candidatus Micrarchaeota archaeon]|nr:anaerobic ribonucleoside-triphosphate reductase activating protein [Candidatus Micrarchaeota archaeon]